MATRAQTYTIYIPAGTKVLPNGEFIKGFPLNSSTHTLIADVYISDAIREEDGGFTYHLVSGKSYYCSAGTCRFRQNQKGVS